MRVRLTYCYLFCARPCVHTFTDVRVCVRVRACACVCECECVCVCGCLFVSWHMCQMIIYVLVFG